MNELFLSYIQKKREKAKLNQLISDFENFISEKPEKKATATKCSTVK